MPNRESLSRIERSILEAFEEVPYISCFFDSNFDIESIKGHELMDDMWTAHEELYVQVQHTLFDLHLKGFL